MSLVVLLVMSLSVSLNIANNNLKPNVSLLHNASPASSSSSLPMLVVGSTNSYSQGVISTFTQSQSGWSAGSSNTIETGTTLNDVALTTDGTLAVATAGTYSPTGTEAYVVKLPSLISTPVTVGTGPIGVAINPSGSYAYVADQDGTINAIDLLNSSYPATSLSATGFACSPTSPTSCSIPEFTGIAACPDGTIVATDYTSDQLDILDISGATVNSSSAVYMTSPVAVACANGYAYVVLGSGSLDEVDLSSGSIISSASLSGSSIAPGGANIAVGNSNIYVSLINSDQLFVYPIGGSTANVTSMSGPEGIGIGGGSTFVAQNTANQVTDITQNISFRVSGPTSVAYVGGSNSFGPTPANEYGNSNASNGCGSCNTSTPGPSSPSFSSVTALGAATGVTVAAASTSLESLMFKLQSRALIAETEDYMALNTAEELVGAPIDTSTGNFTYSLPNISDSGLGLNLSSYITYNSLSSATSSSPSFGYGFTGGLNYSLEANTPASGDYTIIQENGSTVAFYPLVSGACPTGLQVIDPTSILDSGTPYCVEPWTRAEFYSESNGTFTFVRFFPQYEKVSFSSSLALSSLIDQNGQTTTVTTETAGTLNCPSSASTCTVITAPSGRSLTEAICTSSTCSVGSNTYSNNEVESLTDGIHTYTFNYANSSSSCVSTTPATCLAGDLISVTLTAAGDPTSHSWSFGYDETVASGATAPLNRMNTVIDPNNNKEVTNVYDDSSTSDSAYGLVTSQTDAMGRTTGFDYSGLDTSTDINQGTGDVIVTDPIGNKTLYKFSHNVVTSITKGYGSSNESITTYIIDPTTFGASIVDPNGNLTTTTYDSYGRLTSITDPLGDTTTFGYSSTLSPSFYYSTSMVDATGKAELISTFDSFGNQISSEVDGNYGGGTTNPTPTTTYQYCEPSPGTCLSGYSYGELETITDPNGNTTTATYDSSGDAIKLVNQIGDTATATYDSVGRLVTATSPNGNASNCTAGCPATYTTIYSSNSYPYTAFDLPTQIVGPSVSGVSATNTMTYDANGNELTNTTVTGSSSDAPTNTPDPTVVTTNAYNLDNQLCWTTKKFVSSPTCLTIPAGAETVSYAYNADSQVISITNANSQSTSYTYDSQNRLLSQTQPTGLTTTYVYDPNGNVLQAIRSDSLVNTFSYDSTNQLISSVTGVPANGADFSAIGCNSNTCVTGGTTNSGTIGLAYGYNSNVFSSAVSIPSNLNSVSSITCPSGSDCMATAMSQGTPEFLYSTDSGQNFSEIALPAITSASSISCESTTQCEIVGANGAAPVILSLTYSTSWTQSSQSVPTGITSINSVDCISSTNCIAAGQNSNAPAVIVTSNSGSAWSSTNQSFPSGITDLTSVSCMSSSTCVALGLNGSIPILIETTSAFTASTSWSQVSLPANISSLTGISCPSASNCFIAGESTSNTGIVVNLLDLSNVFSTTLATLPPGILRVSGISCVSSTNCFASATEASGGQILEYNGTNWYNNLTSQYYSYDQDGRVTSDYDGQGTTGEITYSYDTIGRLISDTDEFNNITTYGYDLNGNETCVGYQVSSTTACSFPPSTSNTVVDYTYNGANNMTSATTWLPGPGSCGTSSLNTDTTYFSYDNNSNMIGEQMPLCLSTSGSGTWDSIGNNYYTDNTLNKITVNLSAGTNSVTELRNGAGMLTTDFKGYNNGYDSQARLAYSSTTPITSTTPATYTYDNAGNLTVNPSAAYSQCYNTSSEIVSQYAIANPPTSCNSINPAPVNTFTYDSAGNRISYFFPWNGQNLPAYYYYNARGELTTYSVFYTQWNYTYSGSGNLIQVNKGTSSPTTLAQLTYNLTTSPNQILTDGTWDYIYGPNNVPYEAFNPKTANSQIYLISSDNGTEDVGINSSGSTAFINYYGAFGNLATPSSTQPQIGYDGAYLEPGTNCWLMTNRCYDTTTGQFMSVDPSLLLFNQPYSYAGAIPSLYDPTELYRFAYGDPANLSDPTGLGTEGGGPCDISALLQNGSELDPSDKGGSLTRAGRAYAKHMGEPGLPQVNGPPSVLNQAGQNLLEEILTNPGTIYRNKPGGGISGSEFISPSGQSAVYNQNGDFKYFGQEPYPGSGCG